MKIGLVVNPWAGVGGPAGLKGSDGADSVQAALAAGVLPQVAARLASMFGACGGAAHAVSWYTADGDMGLRALHGAGLQASAVVPVASPSQAADTRRASCILAGMGIDLLLFAGGDGTARDVLDGLRDAGVMATLPVLGVPAGVKMQSAVFANHPTAAGLLLRQLRQNGVAICCDAEVMDLDEEALRRNQIVPRLYGYLQLPLAPSLTQGGKSRHASGSGAQRMAIARSFAEGMEARSLYLIGPGSTTQALLSLLGVDGTLLGVDAVLGDGTLLARDASRRELEDLAGDWQSPPHLVLSPIGGQGLVLGRGNQQISPRLLRAAGRRGLHVLAPQDKLLSLHGGVLRIDSGDAELDAQFNGYLPVTTGYREQTMWPVSV
ncbi:MULTISPECIES: ATP-NAD kinase family protein [unclassified Duganella]|uniref:ATP-NAD kinase family protein n=1 Tax=unclassified Duganella TaxID=2636909 RepID=UPI000E3468D9|nr:MULTISPECIES: ATP-NAD kinase family protein [unclassified Duganella]RFP08016.1 ATP-NAD kinase [Duganella sp. BJB475]RFP23825.1 ATP-NAD kinase [Duganella sp. BJB476]